MLDIQNFTVSFSYTEWKKLSNEQICCQINNVNLIVLSVKKQLFSSNIILTTVQYIWYGKRCRQNATVKEV